MGEDGRYLFAVARGLDPADLAGLTGLRGRPLGVVEHRGLQAVVCDVDLDEFGEESLPDRLEDLAWLEEVARGHNDVVWQVAERATVAPMRLVTICTGDDSVRDRVEDNEAGLVRALDQVQGRREWSVKVYAVREQPVDDQPGPGQPAAGAGAGVAYLKRKKEQAARRQQAGDRAAQAAGQVHDTLAAASVASRRLAPQDPRLTGRNEPMVLNSAYLVPVEDADSFRATVRRLQDEQPGVTVEVQGPWPPYSFAVLE